MKLTTRFLLFAATAGLALLAVSRNPMDERKQDTAPISAEADAWFI